MREGRDGRHIETNNRVLPGLLRCNALNRVLATALPREMVFSRKDPLTPFDGPLFADPA